MLHIHNGESSTGTLKEFGFPGEHFAFKDVLMSGPTPTGLHGDEWRRLRATFLAHEYQLKIEDCESSLAQQETLLQSLAGHEEIVLWFEHDMFCQINLIYLLDFFSRAAERTRLSLVCIGEFAGVEDFRGLGQLTGPQLASLFETRHQVTGPEFDTAIRAWACYRSSDPGVLVRLLGEDTTALPFLKNALLLHCSRFPSRANGLGSIAGIALNQISGGATTFKSLFPRFSKGGPPFGLGDSQLWSELKRLAAARHPLINIAGFEDTRAGLATSRFHEATLGVTPDGTRVLEGKLDFVEINGIDVWLGGVHLSNGAAWRWNESARTLEGPS